MNAEQIRTKKRKSRNDYDWGTLYLIMPYMLHLANSCPFFLRICAAKAFCYCPSMISHRPRSQNILKERALNPEKDSRIKRPRSHVSLEKSSQNYKPLENWAKPNLPPDVTPQPGNGFGECIWRVCHVVKPEPREFLAILSSHRKWPRTGERAGWIAVWYSSLRGW